MKNHTMNRIAPFSISLAVLFSAMSCVEKISTEIPDTSDHITVTSEVSPHTKAGYEGTSVLPGTFYMTIKQGASAEDYPMTKSGSSNSYTFPQSNVPTWETHDVSQVSIKAITTPSGYDRATGVMTIPTDQSSAANVQASDLLGAKSGAGITISGNNINVAFNHLMTKMQVTYSSSVEITRIDLANVAVKGTYSYTDMKHTYPDNTSYIGTVERMYKSGNSAEAIFFPFDPRELNVTPKLLIYVSGKNTPIECDITLREGTRFVPGKVYMVKISVTGTSANAEVTVESWGANGGTMQIPGERVLWIGTSIPSGDHAHGITSYPELVDEALNCTIVNNAVAGSLVIPGNPATVKAGGWNHLAAGGLSLTHAEAEASYRQLGLDSGFDQATVETWLNQVKALSYESLIIPYINGEKDYCTTVIIDHGFNDRAAMIFEGIGLQNVPPGIYVHVHGYTYLMNLKNKEAGYSYDDYLTVLANSVGTNGDMTTQGNYIVEMTKVIRAIKAVDPNIRIIIGNYFTMISPYVTQQYSWCEGIAGFEDYRNFTSLICYFNEAVAGLWDLDIVNVQNYLWLSEDDYWAGWDPNANEGNGAPIYDPSKFCPDGVHPYNPDSIRAIADIYIRELEGVIGSRVN